MNPVQINARNAAADEAVKPFETAAFLSCCCTNSQTKINIVRKEKMTMKTTNNLQTTTVTAPEIVCGGCASSIKKAFGGVAGVAEVEVDVETKKVTIKHGDAVSRKEIVAVLDDAGFSAA